VLSFGLIDCYITTRLGSMTNEILVVLFVLGVFFTWGAFFMHHVELVHVKLLRIENHLLGNQAAMLLTDDEMFAMEAADSKVKSRGQ
jgi:hypothetical protein